MTPTLRDLTISAPRSGRLRSHARDAFVFACSAAVIVFLVFFTFADPGVQLASHLSGPTAHTGSSALIAGRVMDGDGGVGGATVLVSAPGRDTRVGTTAEDGTFRIGLGGPCSSYRLEVDARADGRTLSTAATRRLCPGQALELEARVTRSSTLLWMPR
jgi:hypothetical protein